MVTVKALLKFGCLASTSAGGILDYSCATAVNCKGLLRRDQGLMA